MAQQRHGRPSRGMAGPADAWPSRGMAGPAEAWQAQLPAERLNHPEQLPTAITAECGGSHNTPVSKEHVPLSIH